MKADATTRMRYVLVRHDSFCPLAYGEGTSCASGCRPVMQIVDEETMAAQMSSDFKNRAQRRAAAKNKRSTR
jgi:hypothetical protein